MYTTDWRTVVVSLLLLSPPPTTGYCCMLKEVSATLPGGDRAALLVEGKHTEREALSKKIDYLSSLSIEEGKLD